MEKELEVLENLALPELLTRARESEERGEDTVCSEALVYVLRREARSGNADGPGVGGLISILVRRVEKALRRHISNIFDEVQREEICKEVVDRMVDDLIDQSDRADYAEVNFNDWLVHRRDDACRKERRRAARMLRLGDSVAAEDEGRAPDDGSNDGVSETPTPEEAYALTQAKEDVELPPQIESGSFSPEDRERIARMVRRAGLKPNVLEAFLLRHYWCMAIESQDPDKHTLVKHFGKKEKTIRLWLGRAEQAFIKLRGETHGNERGHSSELGVRTARLPR